MIEETTTDNIISDNTSESSDKELCQICMNNDKDIRLECGHCVCCENCILKSTENNCPVCRANIKGYYKNVQRIDSFINPVNGNVVDWGELRELKTKCELPGLYERLYGICVSRNGIFLGSTLLCIGILSILLFRICFHLYS